MRGDAPGYAFTRVYSEPTAAILVDDAGAVPVVSGDPEVGEVLTAVRGDWGPGAWTYAYQWYADGVSISGARSATLTLKAAQVGAEITVIVKGQLPGGNPAWHISEPVGPVTP